MKFLNIRLLLAVAGLTMIVGCSSGSEETNTQDNQGKELEISKFGAATFGESKWN